MTNPIENRISHLFDLLQQPTRVHILLIIREQPACVCHLVAALGLRQASISQHLMVLRKAGWVTTQREGRNIYYSLSDPRLITLFEQAALVTGVGLEDLNRYALRPLPGCPCPQCNPDLPADYSCTDLAKK